MVVAVIEQAPIFSVPCPLQLFQSDNQAVLIISVIFVISP